MTATSVCCRIIGGVGYVWIFGHTPCGKFGCLNAKHAASNETVYSIRSRKSQDGRDLNKENTIVQNEIRKRTPCFSIVILFSKRVFSFDFCDV